MPSNTTYNLRKWLEELTSLRNSAGRTAFVENIKETKRQAHTTLANEARAGASRTEEYSLEMFITPLVQACMEEQSINMSLVDENIRVKIDLDATAGDLQDYAQAVASAREVMTAGNKQVSKAKASTFWRYFVYGPGREGTEPPRGGAVDPDAYEATIRLRLQAAEGKAPYWELIDKGNSSFSFGGGGTPYPSSSGTGFVSIARSKIEMQATAKYKKEVEKIYTALERDNYGGTQILEQIEQSLEDYETAPSVSWIPGEVLKRLRIGDARYKLYITSTGKLGFTSR